MIVSVNILTRVIITWMILCTSQTLFPQSSSDKKYEEEFAIFLESLNKKLQTGEPLNALDYYKGVDLSERVVGDSLRIQFYNIFLAHYGDSGQTKLLVSLADKALPILKKQKDYTNITFTYVHLAKTYISDNDRANFRRICAESVAYYDNENSDHIMKYSAYNNVGVYYHEFLKEYDSAMYFFNRILQYPEVLKTHKHFSGSVYDNIALIHMRKGEFNKARDYFSNNYLNIYPALNDQERWMRAGIQWADTNIKLGNLPEGNRILSQVSTQMDSLGNYPQKVLNRILLAHTYEEYHKALGDYKKVISFSNEASRLKDSIERVEEKIRFDTQADLSRIVMERSKKSYEQEKILRLKEEEKSEVTTWILIMSIAIFVLFIFVIMSHFRFRVRRAKAAKLIEEERANVEKLKNEVLQAEIASKKQDLVDFAVNISYNQKWAKELLGRIKEIKQLKGRSKGKGYEILEKEIKYKVMAEEEIIDFQNRVDLLSNEFYHSLKLQFPFLTKSEIKLCSLIRLNIDNPEIALMQNINLSSVYQNRSRLRTRMKLNPDQDLDTFISEI